MVNIKQVKIETQELIDLLMTYLRSPKEEIFNAIKEKILKLKEDMLSSDLYFIELDYTCAVLKKKFEETTNIFKEYYATEFKEIEAEILTIKNKLQTFASPQKETGGQVKGIDETNVRLDKIHDYTNKE